MRLTRAAQRAQHDPEEPTDATDSAERAPLNEISPNVSPEPVRQEEELPRKTPVKKGKSKAKKGAKGKKAKVVEEEQVPVVLEDEAKMVVGPPRDASIENLAQSTIYAAQVPRSDERPANPPAKATRLTRRQLAQQEEEQSQSQPAQVPVELVEEQEQSVIEVPTKEMVVEPKVLQEDEDEEDVRFEGPGVPNNTIPGPDGHQIASQSEALQAEVVEQPEVPHNITSAPPADAIQESEASHDLVTPSVEILEPEPKTLAIERPVEDAATPVTSRSRRTSRSPSKSPMRLEASFEAIDALEEALENVEAVTSFEHSSDEKSPRKKVFPRAGNASSLREQTPRRTALRAAKVSKTTNAVPKSLKPVGLGRAFSVRVEPSQEVRKTSTDTVDYLASKRRPISVSFPTPPPPPKGRAPTKATFQLSSNDVVAKLKAEKEERLKRQAEGIAPKQRPLSMPPPPKSNKPLTKATFQLPGEQIAENLRARKEERLERMRKAAEGPQISAPRPVGMIIPAKSTKPPTKANFELPGAAIAEELKLKREERLKRAEEAEAIKKAAAVKGRPAAIRKPAPIPTRQQVGVSVPPQSLAQVQRSSSIASKRSSVIISTQSRSTSTSSSNRNSVLVAKSTVTPDDAAAQKVKGREVFNRDKMEKEAKERERREKEEAAKKARADAAERGRNASREWAEKQRKRMMPA